MNVDLQQTHHILFSLLRSGLNGQALPEEDRKLLSEEQIPVLMEIAQKHDIQHLLALALKQNGIATARDTELKRSMIKAVYRYEYLNSAYTTICKALEVENIPFMPLKGAILRGYYPEAWMRTSCDMDILVSPENVDRAAAILVEKYGFTNSGKGSHDISLHAPNKAHIELHFSLIEDGRIQKSSQVLETVWQTAVLREGCRCWYEMPDEMFYFYHIAHMAKHFETGGCGIRPLIDLWYLNRMEADQAKRDALLQQGDLLTFSHEVGKLSRVWFCGEEYDTVSRCVEEFILCGGVYGSKNNATMVNAAKGESKLQNLLKLVFLSGDNLKKLYPKAEKYPILLPYYQVKRWFGVFDRKRRGHVKSLAHMRNAVTQEEINSTSGLLRYLGLD